MNTIAKVVLCCFFSMLSAAAHATANPTLSVGAYNEYPSIELTGTTLNIPANTTVNVTGNISLQNAHIVLQDISSSLICTGTLTIVNVAGTNSISYPVNAPNIPRFSSVVNAGLQPFEFKIREYAAHLILTVNDSGNILAAAYLTKGSAVVTSLAKADFALTDATGTVMTADTIDVNTGIATTEIIGAALGALQLYRVGITSPEGELYEAASSVYVPLSGSSDFAVTAQAWWDESSKKIKVSGWMSMNGALQDSGYVSGDYANVTIQTSSAVSMNETALNASGGILNANIDIAAALGGGTPLSALRDASYAVVIEFKRGSAVRRVLAVVNIPAAPDILYQTTINAGFSGSGTVFVSAVLTAGGGSVTWPGATVIADQCTFSEGTLGTASNSNASPPYVSYNAATSVFSAAFTNAVTGMIYLPRACITAPDGQDYCAVTTVSMPKIGYSLEMTAEAAGDGSIPIRIYLSNDGQIDAAATKGNLTLSVNGNAIAAADIDDTPADGTMTATYPFSQTTPGEIYEIAATYQIGNQYYAKRLKVVVPTLGYQAHLSLSCDTNALTVRTKTWLTRGGETVDDGDMSNNIALSFSPAGPALSGAASYAGGVADATYAGVITNTNYAVTGTVTYGGKTYSAYAGFYAGSVTVDTTALQLAIADVKTDTQAIAVTSQTAADASTSGFLNRETSVRSGTSLVVRYRTLSGLSPTFTLYAPGGTVLRAAQSMTEVGSTGVYEATVTFERAWGTGDFSLTAEETTRATKDAMTMTVVSQDATTISADIEQVTNDLRTVSTGVKEIKSKVTEGGSGEGSAGNIDAKFGEIQQAVAEMGAKAAGSGAVSLRGDMDKSFAALESLRAKVAEMGELQKVGLDKMLSVSDASKGDVGYIRNKTEELKAAMDLSQKMIDGLANAPVVEEWYEFRQ